MYPRWYFEIIDKMARSRDLVIVNSMSVRLAEFSFEVWRDDINYNWRDLGFTESKRKYLERKYPLDGFNDTGCLVSFDRRTLVYRRAEVATGILADLLYLLPHMEDKLVVLAKHITLHGTQVSAVVTQIWKEGYDLTSWHPNLRKATTRELFRRIERRGEHTHTTSRRMNKLAHRMSRLQDMEACHTYLRSVYHEIPG